RPAWPLCAACGTAVRHAGCLELCFDGIKSEAPAHCLDAFSSCEAVSVPRENAMEPLWLPAVAPDRLAGERVAAFAGSLEALALIKPDRPPVGLVDIEGDAARRAAPGRDQQRAADAAAP